MSLVDANPNKSYIKIIVSFDSSATLQEVIDAWTTAPGPSPTGVELFQTSLTGFLNANYDTPVIVKQESKISLRPDGRFEVYEKVTFTGTFKSGITPAQFGNNKDAELNALKGVYNGRFLPPPVSFSNALYHIHKSTGAVNEV